MKSQQYWVNQCTEIIDISLPVLHNPVDIMLYIRKLILQKNDNSEILKVALCRIM